MIDKQEAKARLRELAILLAEAWPAWLGLAFPIAAWILLSLTGEGEKPLMYFGVLLEVAGVLILGWELVEVRKLLNADRPGILVQRWFNRLLAVLSPTLGGRKIESSELASSAEQPSTNSLLDLARQTMQFLDVLRSQVNSSQRVKQLENRIDEESRYAEDQLRQLTSQMEQLSLGNFPREFVGACFIVQGIILANLPEELAALAILMFN